MIWRRFLFILISISGFFGNAFADVQIRVKALQSENKVEIESVLSLLQNLRLSNAPIPKKYDLNIVGDNFWAFFVKRIHSVEEVGDDNSHCQAGAMAFVEQSESPNIAFVCPIFFDKNYSAYEKASILLHEAHHTEGHNHVMCLAGGKVGNYGGCDEKIEAHGAYAVSIETLAKMILRGVDIPQKDLAQLRLGFLEALDSFNISPASNSAIYLQTLDGQDAYFFDGKKRSHAPTFLGRKILSRGLSLLEVPEAGGNIEGLDVFSRELPRVEPLGQCALDYNSGKARTSKLIDVMNDSTYSVCVYEKRIVGRVSAEQSEDASISWPFKAVQVFSADEVGDISRDAVYVKSTRGQFYRVTYAGKGKLKATWTPDPTRGFKQLFFFNSDLTGLREDGLLMKVDFETEQWIPYPGLEKKRFKYSSRPFLWNSDLVGPR